MAISKFKTNWDRRSVYQCRICSHMTRETGLGEQGVELCAACYDLCGYQNSMSDDGVAEMVPQKANILKLIAEVEKRGKGDFGWNKAFAKLLCPQVTK